MKIRDFLKKAAAFAVSAACAFTVAAPVTALADYPVVDRTKDATLELKVGDKYPVSNVKECFTAYEVAAFTDDGKLQWTNAFADEGASITGADKIIEDLNDVTNEQWLTLATTLGDYVNSSETPIDGIKNDVNADGNPYFKIGKDMGVYLVIGTPQTVVDANSIKHTYTPQTVLVSVPFYTNGSDDSTGGYEYDVKADISAKIAEVTTTPTPTPTVTPKPPTSTPKPTTVTTRPTKTGDASNIALWIVVIVAAGVVLGVAVAKKTKKNS